MNLKDVIIESHFGLIVDSFYFQKVNPVIRYNRSDKMIT